MPAGRRCSYSCLDRQTLAAVSEQVADFLVATVFSQCSPHFRLHEVFHEDEDDVVDDDLHFQVLHYRDVDRETEPLPVVDEGTSEAPDREDRAEAQVLDHYQTIPA